jgi:succinyl-CoA synthetase beta subunit
LFSAEGGTGIEELAARQPDSLWKMNLTPQREVLPHHLIEWLSGKGLGGGALIGVDAIRSFLAGQAGVFAAVP